MPINRQVISTLLADGSDLLGMDTLACKLADEKSIVSGSLLTVESNHFGVVKSRGAVLQVYETGQYQLNTADRPILGSIVQGFWNGQSPWQYEIIYINRSKLLVSTRGLATTREMAEVEWHADYYIHVESRDDVLTLLQHLPFAGTKIDTREISAYAGPAISQSVNQIVQVTPLERINENIGALLETVRQHLTEFLGVYGITLNDLKVLVIPRDERIRELISLQALGLSAIDAVRYYLALRMADKGLVSAPNAAIGLPYTVGGSLVGTFPVAPAAGLPTGKG